MKINFQIANLLIKIKIYIVVADISPAGKMEIFQNSHKDRFINVGVAEQTMIGICAGLAASKNTICLYYRNFFSI